MSTRINNLVIPTWLIAIAILGFVSLLGISYFENRRITWSPFGFEPESLGGGAVLKNSITILPASEIAGIWHNKSGSRVIHDFTELVPTEANGVILNVMIKGDSGSGTGSFACGDERGGFPSSNHYFSNGVVNYTNKWVGGTVFCPLKANKTIEWRTMDNEGRSDTILSIASITGWY